MRKILGVLFLVACGDPRAVFVGTYNGTFTRTTTTSSGPSIHSGTASFSLTEEAGSDRLRFSTKCMFSAAVETDTELQMDPVSCPTFHGTTVGGVAADFTDSYGGGTASLINKTLQIDQHGTQVGTNYANGDHNMTYDFAEALTVTRD